MTYFFSSLPPFAFLFQNPEASSSTVFSPVHPFADSRLNPSLWISDSFSPALLTTLKNRHLKAFSGSPATLWLSCCVNRGSLPRGHVPRCRGPGGWRLAQSCAPWAVPTDSLVSAPWGQSPAVCLPSAKGRAPDCSLTNSVRPGQGREAAPCDVDQIQPDSQLFFFIYL